MAKLYNSYAEAQAKGTRCKFALPFSFSLPPIPSISLPSFPFPKIPSIPFWCPLD